MKFHTFIVWLGLLALASSHGTARAVCMYPDRGLSGYKIPLASEVRTADAIVVGRVVSEQALVEDPADPDGVTAYKVTIRVLSRLKGNLPSPFVVRNENTSARYPMSVGEEHILFVSRAADGFRIDSCGNSMPSHRGRKLLKQIRMARHQPDRINRAAP